MPAVILLVDEMACDDPQVLFEAILPGPAEGLWVIRIPQTQIEADAEPRVAMQPCSAESGLGNRPDLAAPVHYHLHLFHGIAFCDQRRVIREHGEAQDDPVRHSPHELNGLDTCQAVQYRDGHGGPLKDGRQIEDRHDRVGLGAAAPKVRAAAASSSGLASGGRGNGGPNTRNHQAIA